MRVNRGSLESKLTEPIPPNGVSLLYVAVAADQLGLFSLVDESGRSCTTEHTRHGEH